MYDKYNYLLGCTSFICAILFALFGICSPPIGEISQSVLWFIAQLLLFTASCFNLRAFTNKFNKSNT